MTTTSNTASNPIDDFPKSYDPAAIERVSQGQHRLHVTGDIQFTRKEQRIRIATALKQAEKQHQWPFDGGVGRVCPLTRGDQRPCFRNDGEVQREIRQVKAVADPPIVSQPLEKIRMGI